jgi:formylglycine-generating enzyme required for sulfatase activity
MSTNSECESYFTVKRQRVAMIGNAFPLMMGFVTRAVVITCLLGLVTPARSQETERPPENAAARAKAQALFENLIKEREKIVSAVVQVQVSQVFRKDDPLPERAIRGMYAFDYSQELFRFDGSRRMRIGSIPPGAGIAQAVHEDVDAKLRYLRTRDHTATWSKSSPRDQATIFLGPPGRLLMGGPLAERHYLFDLRACGLMSHFDFTSNERKNIKDYCDTMLKLSVIEVSEKEELTTIAMRSNFAEYRLTIDLAHQFTPVEYIRSWKKGPGNSSDGSTSTRVTWTEIAGVPVPKSLTIEFDWPDEKQYGLYRFLLLWKNVNQPIDPQYFDYKSFPDIPPGTDVADNRIKGSPRIGFWTESEIVGPEDNNADNKIDPTTTQPGDAANTQTLIEGIKPGDERDDNGLKMKFVWCPPGKFKMGSAPDDPERFTKNQVEVVLTQGWWMGKYEVTQGEWAQLKTPLLWKGQKYVEEGDDYPATYLSWKNAMAFCRKLTRQERAAGRLPLGWQYTLPTEAQWEYACRGGTTTPFSFGNDEALLVDYAWIRNNCGAVNELYAHVVGAKRPNPFGLHDMHGNVSEWCRDGWQDNLPSGTDPFNLAKDELRVVRGGCFTHPGVVCCSAYRDAAHVVNWASFIGEIGFRVALCRVENQKK